MRSLWLLLVASPLFAQGRTPDLAGTWTLNATKSRSSQPLPATRTLVIAHAPSGYVLHQIDGGADSSTFSISLTRTVGDTIAYVIDITDDQGLASTKSGRLFLSNGGRMLTDVSEIVAGGEPVDQQLVFDRKR